MNRNVKDDPLDLDSLLHPAQAFEHPLQVVNDPDLTLNEKRAILSSWASDACAVAAAPALRHAPNGTTVTFDSIMDAMRLLDEQAQWNDGRAKYKKRLRISGVRTLANRLRKRSDNDDRGPLGASG